MTSAALGRTRVFATLIFVILVSALVVSAIALASRSDDEPTARERCERRGGIWHDSAGHGASAAHCMGGTIAE
jgi:hypothetical protein